ncbi:GH39 family glycosyl hydrolase [Pseudofrankia sp. EUN1h]|uniref:GH39 family glycosyl hydrolase n=1 Tax=Pseudofrankia sp. EUN1h TaxID=1834515 RepID=UPI00031F5D05|nr:discoidin domain-containing protein [Pseudofrankia sp. EUN1h]OHV41023.1 hypothetical protein BCD49_39065 [Pseudofrankia sp. EUN1h]
MTARSVAAVAPTPADDGATLSTDFATADGAIDPDQLLNVAEGGYGPMQNQHWFAQQAGQLSSMGVRQVRLDHVFDDGYYHVVHKDASGAITYDFSYLDKVLLPLAHNGLDPFISLSYTPKALGPVVFGPPDSDKAWADAVTAMVRHYRTLGYSGWTWEIWNEPDGEFWNGTVEQYESMYAAAATAVKAADPTALVGGDGAASLAFLPKNIPFNAAFLSWLQANPRIPMDFFSYHQYLTDDFNTPGDFRGTAGVSAATARQMIDTAGRGSAKLYLTEWNANSDNVDAGTGGDANGGSGGASDVAKQLSSAVGSDLDKIYYFSAMEGGKPAVEFSGDLGLLTDTGHRKAAANVFQMYSQLAGSRLTTTVTGPGVSTNDVNGLASKNSTTGEMTLLLWNNTAAATTMKLSLGQLPYAQTAFSVTQTRVSKTEGNYYTSVKGARPAASENAPVVAATVQPAATSYQAVIALADHSVTLLRLAPTTQPPGTVATSPQPVVTDLAAAASGATTTASSSVKDPKHGWDLTFAVDGQRHSFDGDGAGGPNEGWSSATHTTPNAGEYIQSDFGATKPVDTVTLWPRDTYAHNGAGFPTAFTIAGSSDDQSWNTLYKTGNYNDGKPVDGPQTFDVAPGSYRYLRVSATRLGAVTNENGTTDYGFQLAELEATHNGLPAAGFENTTSPWTTDGHVAITHDTVFSGNGALELDGTCSGIRYTATGLTPNTKYTFGGYIKRGSADVRASLGVKDFGGTPLHSTVDSTAWAATWVTFTTGANTTKATVYLNKNQGGGPLQADDFTLQAG